MTWDWPTALWAYSNPAQSEPSPSNQNLTTKTGKWLHILFLLAAYPSLSEASSPHSRTTPQGVGGHRYSHYCQPAREAVVGGGGTQVFPNPWRWRKPYDRLCNIWNHNETTYHSSLVAPENMCVKQENQTIENTPNPLMQCPREPTYSLQLSPTNNSPLAGKEVTMSHSSRWPSKPVSLSPEMCILCHCPSYLFQLQEQDRSSKWLQTESPFSATDASPEAGPGQVQLSPSRRGNGYRASTEMAKPCQIGRTVSAHCHYKSTNRIKVSAKEKLSSRC